MKFLILWAIVMVADFMFMFRFEFLWPFWLLLRSVHDSFKYKGLVSGRAMFMRMAKVIVTLYGPISFAGILRTVRVHSDNVGSGLFILHTRSLAALCSEHLCVGAVRLAHRCVIRSGSGEILWTSSPNFIVRFLTDKGICLPTIILWMLFVYLEVGIRWKDSRHMPHLDLCRPFAAHW